MSYRHVIVLTCDHRSDDGVRCPGWFLGPSSTDIEGVRRAVAEQGWRFHPGTPYAHVDGTDTCPRHPADKAADER